MSDVKKVEERLRHRVERFLEESGSFLNDGAFLGVDDDGDLISSNGYGPHSGCCVLGVVCLGANYPDMITRYAVIAGTILGCSREEAQDIEYGYRFRDSGKTGPFADLGHKIREEYGPAW